MAKLIDVRDLATQLEEALAAAAAGEDVILTDGNTLRARFVPLPTRGPCIPGLHPGAMEAAPDFDDPLPDDFWLGEQ